MAEGFAESGDDAGGATVIARNELRNLLLVLDGSAVLLDAHRRKLLYNELDEHLSRPDGAAYGKSGGRSPARP